MIASFFVWAAVPALMADMLITKDGKSFWLVSYGRKADSMTFKVTEDGPEQSIPLADVDLILPSVRQGTQYTPEQADKALDNVKRAAAKYPLLRKQMELLKQQWQQVKDPDTGADGKVEQLLQQFKASDKSPRKFQDLAVQMEMIALRDAVGAVTGKIKKTVVEMQLEVFDTARAKIETMASADKRTLENYNNIRKLVLEMRMTRATEEQKKYLDEVHEKCRKETMQSALQSSQSAYFSKKTVDGYLDSMGILSDLKRSVVLVAAAEKAEVDRYIKVILSAAKTDCKGYDFEIKNCPLDVQDKKLLTGRKYDSVGAPGAMPTVEHCYLIATGVPPDAKPGDSVSFPVRLIFSRTPVTGRKYSLVADFIVPGNLKREIREVSLQGMQAGHIDTVMKVVVPRLEPKFSGTPVPWNGVTALSLVLAYQDYRSPVSEQTEWIAATAGCWMGFGTPVAVPQKIGQ